MKVSDVIFAGSLLALMSTVMVVIHLVGELLV